MQKQGNTELEKKTKECTDNKKNMVTRKSTIKENHI